MLLRLRKSLLHSKQIRTLVQAHSLTKLRPVTPVISRSITVLLPRRLQEQTVEVPPVQSMYSEKDLTEYLEEVRLTGNLKGAIKKIKQAETQGMATSAIYLQLIDILREAPFEMNECSTVASWFYSPETDVPLETLKDLEIWKSVLKLGFRLGSTYRKEDLRALIDRFTEIFDLTTLDDPIAWQLLMRAYGILGKENAITACAEKNKERMIGNEQFTSALLLSYAATNSHDKVQALFMDLKEKNQLKLHVVKKLIRSYAFCGEIEEVKKYMNLCDDLFPAETTKDKTLQLIAHKVALQKMLDVLRKYNGARGIPLKPANDAEWNKIQSSWNELTKDIFNSENESVDIVDCNLILEYLVTANRIDPVKYPMEKAADFFVSFIPAHNATANEYSHRIMLTGYAATQQYNDPHHNTRLDKTLEFLGTMQANGIHIMNHPTFHALFRACIPHLPNKYYYDNYQLNSLLPNRPYTHFTFPVDRRIFEIEEIMLEAHLPHDRFTFTTLLTSLSAGGQFHEARKRWRSLKEYGFHRDKGMHRLAFALASLDQKESKRALTVLKSEMIREIPHHHIDWNIYLAMLDCCVTAQLPDEAMAIIRQMRDASKHVYSNKHRSHVDDLTAWPYPDEPNYYYPILRAAVSIPGLDAEKIINEINHKGIEYSHGLWELMLSKSELENDINAIQSLFHKYTMSRFEKRGLIPTPAREVSPIVPFPSAPYNTLDMKFINSYIGSLVDSQNVSILFDVLHTLNDQTANIGISHDILVGIVKLTKKEKSKDDMKWLLDNIIPKISKQNRSLKKIRKHIEHTLQVI